MGNKKNQRKKTKKALELQTESLVVKEASLVSPDTSEVSKRDLLFKAIDDSLSWKLNAKKEKPYPIEEFLDKNGTSIQMILLESQHYFDEETCPTRIKMLLFTFCALFIVIKKDYDIYDRVARAFGGITKESLKSICDSVLLEFVEGHLAFYAIDSRLQTLFEAVRKGPSDLKAHLESAYTKDKLYSILYGRDSKPSSPKSWNIDMKFLSLALKSSLPPGAPKNELISNAFGVAESSFQKNIKAEVIKQDLIEALNEDLTYMNHFLCNRDCDMNHFLCNHDCESTPITSSVVSPRDDTSCDIESASLSDSDCEPNPVSSKINSFRECGGQTEIRRDHVSYQIGDTEGTSIRKFVEELSQEHDCKDKTVKLDLSGTVPEVLAQLEEISCWLIRSKAKNLVTLVTNARHSKKSHTFAVLPHITKDFSDLEAKSKREKTKLGLSVLQHLASKDEDNKYQQKQLFLSIAEKFDDIIVMNKDNVESSLERMAGDFSDIRVMRNENFEYSIVEVAALRHFLKCSANTVARIDQFERYIKGCTRFPTRLLHKLLEYEKQCNLNTNHPTLEIDQSDHQNIKREADLVNKIGDQEILAEPMNRQLQDPSKDDVVAILERLEEGIKGPKRGPYAKKQKATGKDVQEM